MHLDVVTKTINKKDRRSHLLPVNLRVHYFSPWCCHTSQGILIKTSKNSCVIFDALMKGDPHKVIFNDMTTTDFKAIITFGEAKLLLPQWIYNWRINHPNSKIYVAHADILIPKNSY